MLNIKIYILGFLILSALGCVSIQPNRPPLKETVFKGSMEKVWMAAEKVLADYPISESNVDSGVLKTDYIRGPNCWHAPTYTEKYTSGVRCSLQLQILKISGNAVRIRITKSLQLVKDFVSEPEDLPSDGLEEMNILYRIDRELTIAQEITKQ